MFNLVLNDFVSHNYILEQRYRKHNNLANANICMSQNRKNL